MNPAIKPNSIELNLVAHLVGLAHEMHNEMHRSLKRLHNAIQRSWVFPAMPHLYHCLMKIEWL